MKFTKTLIATALLASFAGSGVDKGAGDKGGSVGGVAGGGVGVGKPDPQAIGIRPTRSSSGHAEAGLICFSRA